MDFTEFIAGLVEQMAVIDAEIATQVSRQQNALGQAQAAADRIVPLQSLRDQAQAVLDMLEE